MYLALQESSVLYWTNPGSNAEQNGNSTAYNF